MTRFLFLLFTCLLASQAAIAADYGISEIKGGLLTQSSSMADSDDPLQPWIQKDETDTSLNAAVLFNGPDWFERIYTPRIQVGAGISLHGDTSYVYSDLYWDRALSKNFYIAGFFGLAVHDGEIEHAPSNPAYGRDRMLGSRVLFHLGPEIGYNITPHHNISLIWAHMSNGWLLNGFDVDGHNEGLDQVGVRYGYRF